MTGGTKRKGEVLDPDRANQGAWEDHRRFGEKHGKATIFHWQNVQAEFGDLPFIALEYELG